MCCVYVCVEAPSLFLQKSSPVSARDRPYAPSLSATKALRMRGAGELVQVDFLAKEEVKREGKERGEK